MADAECPMAISPEDVDKKMDACRIEIHERLDKGAARMEQMHSEICANTDRMESVTESLDKFLEVWKAGEGFVRVVQWFFKAAKFILTLGAFLAAAAAFIHYGGTHK